ncbi:MAG: phosphoenolpyruvate--protein phosphotransferase [Deltaproteobacteria bacterium RIFCSPLOWO2_01_44_7]|nr:MAG: phosphoenolpyruvate--protein phosphotransferase [Deltaproteobacteria bacterium RIFCSPHIGHO2_01_FULL_43_49]OGQ16296.1 MAG: phosphoenolpyruvate--protein phosphotransferase [Deltaproteobacteria bacterium RIFCSPHIGHO2_02_FULL_44_53]OGQ29256.1 MAG: phosphoenolpyruvate--protein phosphotransferase [Deltaproteobacteria bacterium RIFCSPHIGHO2_12_FULL_44_21]OGQ32813.1 MAG: phosphoenolpyruvate--protein phosphotransferase [Deltaproteobacteria bacterium RIFCSPLOWO2_01_FULL_45_74]OGQ38725.1 MAG: phos
MSEQILKGQGSSQGIAIGQAYLLPPTSFSEHRWITSQEIGSELKRLSKAIFKMQNQWSAMHDKTRILEVERLFLKDETLRKLVKHYIKVYHVNAEWALELAKNYFSTASKSEEIRMAIAKLQESLSHKKSFELSSNSKIKNKILVAEALSPSEVATLAKGHVLGIITSTGGAASHPIILARSLRLPAIGGVENVHQHLRTGTKLILDGFEGKVLIAPTPSQLKGYRELSLKHRLLEKLLLKGAQTAAFTKDQKQIRLEANVEVAEEIPSLIKYGAEGIGLFRTDLLFANPIKPPSEESQVKLYEKLLKGMSGKPVTLRTFDISGEEWLKTETANLALGLRGIRFSLNEESLLKTQLRAILKASPKGPVNILLPMVSSIEEVDNFIAIYRQVQKELKKEKVSFRKKIPLGITIEIPAVCFIMKDFTKKIDFFAIGTNDLIQYTLAVDRTNEHVANLYSPVHPAILKILKQTIGEAKKMKKAIYLCGELAGDPLFLPLLIGLGLTHFSMNAQSIPKAKKMIRLLSIKGCVKWVEKLLKLSHIKAIEKQLKNFALELDTP